MEIQTLSTAARPDRNEDLVTSFTHGDGTLDLLVFDGASSVSGHDYLDAALGDPAWFVQQFSAALETVATPMTSQGDSMTLALHALHERHHALLVAAAMPCYAWPIAALSWLRVQANGIDAWLYALGDCKTFLLNAEGHVTDLDPYENPQEGLLKAAVEQLKHEGLDEQARWARLLPMLRERRVAQNMSMQPSIVCMHPQGRFAAREHPVRLAGASSLLMMTDGFYRLVDHYHLHDDQSLMQTCTMHGLDVLMLQLRTHEAGETSAGMSVKKADDASVAMLKPGLQHN
ncbi:hypothetical protein [Undibacterium sp. TJN19]|uniref:hypothetical protein n=1 Tax=Undibacterium sp. TJN19 TaxID=3413055 RepID=UPI003BF3E847